MKQNPNKRARWVGAGIAGAALLGGGILWLAGGEEPPPAPATRPPMVEYVLAEVREQRASVSAYGKVDAVDRTALAPQVAGRVERVAAGLAVGARLRRGELLFAIDPRDFQFAVTRAEAELRSAEARWREARGRQAIAQGEWDLLPAEVRAATADPGLVRREPQLLEAEALRRAAQGALEEAELNLARTELRTPFAAVVLAEDVAPGRQVAAGEGVVMIAAAAEWTADLALPETAADLVETEGTVPVTLRRSLSDGRPFVGEVVALLGEVDGRDRQARLRVRIPTGGAAERLRIGAEVTGLVPTRLLGAVARIPTEALRTGGVVWVLGDHEQLEMRKVTVLLRSGGEAYVRGELRTGERIIVGNLATPLAGMQLQGVART